MSNHESAALWQLYANLESGVAIRTELGSLTKSLPPDDERDFYVGKAIYGDHLTEKVPWNDTLSPFIHKLSAYAYESELRVVSPLHKVADRKEEQLPAGHPKHGWDYFVPDVASPLSEDRKFFPVDLNGLIHQIVVSPLAPPSLLDVVTSLAETHKLTAPVCRSNLSSTPTWGSLEGLSPKGDDLKDLVLMRNGETNELFVWVQ